jgi:hypothetical protein
MKVVFESSPIRFEFPFRIFGNAGRYDTISDCEFIDDRQIVCVDRQMAKLYLIQFDLPTDSYTILDSQTVICEGQPQHFELISIRKHTESDIYTVYSISYQNTLFSCEIIDNKFCHFRTTVVNPREKYHGVLAFDLDKVYVTNMLYSSITEYDTKTKTQKSIVCSGGTRMKDVAIIDKDYIIVISSDSGPVLGKRAPDGKVSPLNILYDSHALIYNRHTAKLMARHTFPNTQIDGCIYMAPYCFITCAKIDGTGYIWRAKIDNSYQFTQMKHISCAGFPHGLALRDHTFAYTSYDESALYIEDVGSFGLLD